MITVELSGGFHNITDPIRLRLKNLTKQQAEEGHRSEILDHLSDGQRRKLWKHMCGISDCQCSSHGWDIEVV